MYLLTHNSDRAGVLTGSQREAGGSPAIVEGEHQLYREDEMSGWEYLLLNIGDWEFGRLHETLAELTRQGWEVSHAIGGDSVPLRPDSGVLMLRLRRQAAA